MKIRLLLWMMLVLLGAFVLITGESLLLQRSLSGKTLRLHVVANSDSAEDQELKLRLRDHILKELENITSNCSTVEEVNHEIQPKLKLLEASAKAFLQEEGSSYGVKVSLCREYFPTRPYLFFTFPAGEYEALRVTIGEAEGKNWWCVIFPALCDGASLKEARGLAEEGGFQEEEWHLIDRKDGEFSIRFKLLEWVGVLFH